MAAGFRAAIRHLVPRTTVEISATRFRDAAAPLLEEKRDMRVGALVANVAHPPGVDSATDRSALAANDYPVDAVERKTWDRAEQWLDREEANGGRDVLKV